MDEVRLIRSIESLAHFNQTIMPAVGMRGPIPVPASIVEASRVLDAHLRFALMSPRKRNFLDRARGRSFASHLPMPGRRACK